MPFALGFSFGRLAFGPLMRPSSFSHVVKGTILSNGSWPGSSPGAWQPPVHTSRLLPRNFDGCVDEKDLIVLSVASKYSVDCNDKGHVKDLKSSCWPHSCCCCCLNLPWCGTCETGDKGRENAGGRVGRELSLRMEPDRVPADDRLRPVTSSFSVELVGCRFNRWPCGKIVRLIEESSAAALPSPEPTMLPMQRPLPE